MNRRKLLAPLIALAPVLSIALAVAGAIVMYVASEVEPADHDFLAYLSIALLVAAAALVGLVIGGNRGDDGPR